MPKDHCTIKPLDIDGTLVAFHRTPEAKTFRIVISRGHVHCEIKNPSIATDEILAIFSDQIGRVIINEIEQEK